MIKTILIAAIRSYRFALSPWMGNACRFWPTCSEYSMQAIEAQGRAERELGDARPLARCHPYGAGGADPVRFDLAGEDVSSNELRATFSTSIEAGHDALRTAPRILLLFRFHTLCVGQVESNGRAPRSSLARRRKLCRACQDHRQASRSAERRPVPEASRARQPSRRRRAY